MVNKIKDFNDFNNKLIILDISGVDKTMLLYKLSRDHINRRGEIYDSKFVLIDHGDLHGYEKLTDIPIAQNEADVTVARLVESGYGFGYVTDFFNRY